ncbi:aminotransferase class I/II-fold pyridoxal phosphate-dependent enzyme [Rhodococcus sp. D2-41]|uniref:Histidinol-phosphate transaminase n=1 Tax=Speluncibacter jeojiensis TaxID=2710754 RepID=A0A9X4M3L9_9ACTN|nr:histidinol-phosphate transaminase [Rhodococcus sp. D2-41]MDG3010829.1 aminotransferase class I/II-fold pyridoxal phosphate-dependent enzyme [Rhodococcus sp. D2-41]MDG3013801.1 histidinol-phosphate transaminase [Corynebacteriales bacterium D3-21]
MSRLQGDGPRPRPALDSVARYVPQPPKAPAGVLPHRLFLNENPYPPLPSVLAVINDAATGINRYPDIEPTTLIAALARRHSCHTDDILTGPGTMGIYQQIAQAMLRPGDDIVYAWPSFEAFPIVAAIAGCTTREVPLRDHHHDLQAIAEAIGERTRAVFVCNPNNPTGTLIPGDDLQAFLEQIPDDVLVLIDEAYAEFVPDHQGPSGLDLYRRFRNVVVLRTFSKAYGLAGLRVGYGLAHPTLAGAFRKCAVPCGVSTIAIAAALRSLEAEDELFERVRHVIDARDRLGAELSHMGLRVPTSAANFLWIDIGAHAAELGTQIESSGILARVVPDHGIRLTIGDKRANTDAEWALGGALATSETWGRSFY